MKNCIVGLLLTRPITLLAMVVWVVGELNVCICVVWWQLDIHFGGLTGCCILLGSVRACRFRLGGLTARVVLIWVVLDVMCCLCLVLSHIIVATANLM
mgnify:CR=1 FL=1